MKEKKKKKKTAHLKLLSVTCCLADTSFSFGRESRHGPTVEWYGKWIRV